MCNAAEAAQRIKDSALLEVLERSKELGFLGPGSLQTHINHALAMAEFAGVRPRRILDLGSGGGVPGLVFGYVWIDCQVLLLDASTKRALFLEQAVQQLEFEDRIDVVHGRAEEEARQERFRSSFDLVTARSFGPPAVTAECAAGFLTLGGRLVVSEPPDLEGATTPTPQGIPREERWPIEQLEELGLVRHSETPAGGLPRFVALCQTAPCPSRYPRRNGVPRKRPLF